MCRLSGLKHNEPLPAFDIWLTDASPSHALSELASSQDGNTIHLQQTSSLLASLRQEDPSALEDQWALLCPAASPLFFIVLQLCEYWMTRLEASSYTHSLHDKDGLTLGMTPLEHRRSDLVWVQITSLATLDHLLDPSSSSSISPFLCLVFRQTLAASGLGPSSALLKVIANGVLKSLSASIDPAFLADSLQQLLRLSATRCSWFAPSALATVLAGLPDARLAHRALMQVVPELSDAFANPFFSHGLDEFLAELGHLSPTLGLATAEHLVSRIQHTLDHAKTETGSSSQSYGLVLGLKRLNALSKLSTTQQTILQDDPVLASLFMAPGAAHEHQTAVSGAEHFQLSSVADLVKRPLCRHVKSDGQGFAIKRYEGSEAFRQRVQVNSNNVRPPSLHVDAFATAN